MGSDKGTKYIFQYPKWWWRIGYLLGIFPLFISIYAVIYYIVVPTAVLKGLLILIAICLPIALFTFQAARKYQKLYSEIIVDERGISGPIIQSPDSFKRIRTNTFVPWNDVVTIEKFSGTDLDALRIGPTASGIRIFVKDGRILILDRIPGFQDIVEKIKQATDKRVHHVL